MSGLALTGTDAGELHADAADDDGEHHGGDLDGDGHHREQQGLRRHHSGHARHHGAALVGAVSGDTGVTFSAAGATGTFASPNAANGITVQVAGIRRMTEDGTAASDYTLTATTMANIPGRVGDGVDHREPDQAVRRHCGRDAGVGELQPDWARRAVRASW